GRVEVEGDLAKTLSGGRGGARENSLEEELRGRVTSDTTIDDTAEEGGTTETVGTVDTTSDFTAGVETVEWLALWVEDAGLVVNFNTAHGEVEDWLHEGNVELVVNVEWNSWEELLSVWILLLAVGNVVVGLEGGLQLLWLDAHLSSELLASHLLHEATARVMA